MAGARLGLLAADSGLPLMDVSTQTQLTAEVSTQERTFARLSSFFGILALLLATIGLYGTMSYSVTRTTHEIGIRLALGAEPGDVLRMVLGKGLQLTLAGVVSGVLAALASTRLISTMIYGVVPTDPTTFAAVAAFFLLVALLAC
jgi:ABC-type antimicrobial peptide transport system permease subunit